jgi:hypothetical protein
MANRTRLAATTGAILIAAVGAYWYWSPYLAMHAMKDAVDKRDADAFNQYVDYPKLRESFKGQLSAMLTKSLGMQQPGGGSEPANAGAALGAMLGLAFADKLIDVMVRPEVVMQAMEEGKLQNPAVSPKSDQTAPAATDKERVKWSLERKGFDRVIARNLQGEAQVQTAPAESPAFVFDRNGFAAWKLTEIRLPAKK